MSSTSQFIMPLIVLTFMNQYKQLIVYLAKYRSTKRMPKHWCIFFMRLSMSMNCLAR